MRIKIHTIILALTTLAAARPTMAQAPLSLTLERCIEVAISDNPTIRIADMEIKRMDFSKKETLGQLLPTVAFGGSYSRMLAKQVTYMNMSAFSSLGSLGSGNASGSDSGESEDSEDSDESRGDSSGSSGSSSSSADKGIKMGLDNSWQVGFTASIPLVAPQLWKMLKLSDSQILESVEASRQGKLSLINQVKNAWYTLLLALDSRRVINESYEMAALTASTYEKKLSVGAASEYDVLRTQVAMRNIEPEMLQSEIAIKQAKLKLLILMGIDTNIDIVAQDSLQRYEGTMYEKALSINRNISGNADLRMLDIKTRQIDDMLAVKKAAWYPTLALTANYSWTSSSNGSPFKNFRWNPYSVIGLQLSLPLYQGGQRFYAIKQAEIQAGEMTWQRENLVRTINMQVDLAIDNIDRNIRQIASSSQNVGQAEKAHGIMERSFEIGAASYLDLRDAQLALTRSRLAYYESIYNYLIACSDLELLLGNAEIPVN